MLTGEVLKEDKCDDLFRNFQRSPYARGIIAVNDILGNNLWFQCTSFVYLLKQMWSQNVTQSSLPTEEVPGRSITEINSAASQIFQFQPDKTEYAFMCGMKSMHVTNSDKDLWNELGESASKTWTDMSYWAEKFTPRTSSKFCTKSSISSLMGALRGMEL